LFELKPIQQGSTIKFLKMKNLPILLLFLFSAQAAFAQTRLYENPDFDRIALRHKVIAVVPFEATVELRPKQMEQVSPEQLEEMELEEGKDLQAAMFSWFLKRKERGKLTVDVQSTAITNAKLKQEGISVDNYEDYTPDQIAKILEVDAVIMGTFETNKPMSEGAAVAVGALLGFWGSTNKAVVNLFIYNAKDSEVLVNYHKAVQGSVGSTAEQLINVLMRKASRRIAYTK